MIQSILLRFFKLKLSTQPNEMEVKCMSPKIDKKVNVLTPAAEEPITDFEMVMDKIEHDSHKKYNGIENISFENENIEKDKDEVET